MARSNAGTCGPVVSQSERSTAITDCRPSSSSACRPYGSIVARTGRPPSMARGSITSQLPHLVPGQPYVVGVARIAEALSRALAVAGREAPRGEQGLDHEHLVELEGLAALVLGDQNLVELFAGADADVLDDAARRD